MLSLFNRSDGSRPGLASSLEEGNYTPQLLIASTTASILALVGVLGVALFTPDPEVTLVQTQDGPITVQEQDHLYRSPQTIQNYTAQSMSQLLNWSGYTVNKYGVATRDPGVKIGSQHVLPTAAYEAANAFTTDGRLRTQVISRLAKWAGGGLGGARQQRLEIKKILIPQALEEPGHWKVNIIATRVVTSGRLSEPITFNRSLYVRSVPVVEDPTPETSTPERKAFYRVRKHGLEIYRMEKFSRDS